MMDTVNFENDTGKILRIDDYGLLLKYFSAPEPDVKIYTEAIEGADGDLDMTEWAGVVRYKDRKVEIGLRDITDQWWREIVAFCHGRKIKITHSDDPTHYYYGRCAVSHKTASRVTDLTITATCNPYRLCHMETVETYTVSSSKTITLEALRRPVTPTVTVSAQMTLVYEGSGITLAAGTHELPDLVLTDTPVTVTVTGSGTITFKWRDGEL